MIQQRVRQHMTALGYNAMYFSDDKGTLTAAGENAIATGLAVLLDAVAMNNFEKGWRTPTSEPRNMGELIALIHSETSEAFEAYRNNEPVLWYEVPGSADKVNFQQKACDGSDEIVLGKPEGIGSELADIIIRVVDMAQEHDIPVIDAVINKHAYNQTRPWKHGGKAC